MWWWHSLACRGGKKRTAGVFACLFNYSIFRVCVLIILAIWDINARHLRAANVYVVNASGLTFKFISIFNFIYCIKLKIKL